MGRHAALGCRSIFGCIKSRRCAQRYEDSKQLNEINRIEVIGTILIAPKTASALICEKESRICRSSSIQTYGSYIHQDDVFTITIGSDPTIRVSLQHQPLISYLVFVAQLEGGLVTENNQDSRAISASIVFDVPLNEQLQKRRNQDSLLGNDQVL